MPSKTLHILGPVANEGNAERKDGHKNVRNNPHGSLRNNIRNPGCIAPLPRGRVFPCDRCVSSCALLPAASGQCEGVLR